MHKGQYSLQTTLSQKLDLQASEKHHRTTPVARYDYQAPLPYKALPTMCFRLEKYADGQMEWYEASSGCAEARMNALRSVGFQATIGKVESKCTKMGIVSAVTLTIVDLTGREIPKPTAVFEYINHATV